MVGDTISFLLQVSILKMLSIHGESKYVCKTGKFFRTPDLPRQVWGTGPLGVKKCFSFQKPHINVF